MGWGRAECVPIVLDQSRREAAFRGAEYSERVNEPSASPSS
jgi:hypothetical protein